MTNRDLSLEEFGQISDGKMYSAEEALDRNLIDEIGGVQEVKEYLSEQLSIPADELLLCEPSEV